MPEFTFSPDILYQYGETAVSSSPDIIYEYSASAMETSFSDVVYQYGNSADRWERQRQHWAFTTQELANMFPRWHDIRHNIGGPSQELINSWGINFDKVKREYARFRKQMFLETAGYEEPDKFAHAGVRNFNIGDLKENENNFLVNTDFSLPGLARRNVPAWWSSLLAESTGTVEAVEHPVMLGSRSVKLHTEAGENAYLRQQAVGELEGGRYVTASLWYMSPVPTGVLSADGRAKLEVFVIYEDGMADFKSVDLNLATNGEWVRAQASLYLEKDIWSFTYLIRMENTGDAACRIYAGAAQLELGQTATAWSPSQITVVPYIVDRSVPLSPFDAYIDEGVEDITEEIISGEPLTYSGRRGRTLLQVPEYHHLWFNTVPRKATTAAVVGDTPIARQEPTWGSYATPERERFTSGFRIANNKIEQYNLEITNEIIAIWDIGEFWLDEGHTLHVGIDTDVTRTLEALTIFKGMLWVLCTEDEGSGAIRTLKALNPCSRWPIPEAQDQELPCLHLECIGDVDIGLASGTADYLGWVEANPDQFLIRVEDTYYTVDLEYDYYYLDVERRQAILRHPYQGKLVTV